MCFVLVLVLISSRISSRDIHIVPRGDTKAVGSSHASAYHSLATSETRARAAIVEIKSACLEHGSFLVKEYDAILSPSLLDRTLDAERTFFARDCLMKDPI
jgi:hypothetical protein